MAKNKLPVLLPAAKRDIKKAYEWYEEQKSGLGDVFLERVEECLKTIGRNPKAFQLVVKDARRAIVKQFPSVIFYRIETKAIYVYSIFHTLTKPAEMDGPIGRLMWSAPAEGMGNMRYAIYLSAAA